jgi:hypothetical protein
VPPAPLAVMPNTIQMPSRKWWATQITALCGLVTAWIVAGAWNQSLSIAAVTLFGQAAVGYLVPNVAPLDPASAPAPAPAVPERKPVG